MKVKNPVKEGASSKAHNWKARYEKQTFLIGSMTSLLSRYGSSIELTHLYSAYLLTLMGQFVVGDACYYSYSSKDHLLEPVLAYGRLTRADLPPVSVAPDDVGRLMENPMPTRVEDLLPGLATATGMKFLAGNYRVFAPLFLKEKFVGSVFLGNKVSKQSFTSTDLDVLSALSAVSATTFNNAILYENAQHSAREIRRLYEVRNEVINRVSHEFRTPLTIMKAGVEMLAKEGTHSELAQLFQESETRLEDLINSLLSLSQKSTEDEGEHRTEALTVLHDSIHRRSGAAQEKNIHFKVVQNTGATAPVLPMSEVDLRTILDALLENAVKFSPADATVAVEVELTPSGPSVERDGLLLPDWKEQTEDLIRKYRQMAPEEDEAANAPAGRQVDQKTRRKECEFLVVRISDNGIGIPEEDLMMVAEPFRQASNSPDLGVKGKGLGLALVHKVLTRHGGHLCCKSAEGRGTTFSAYLPVENDSRF
jgi:two-component system phosphate regulon sensor histidine kinase PhoR